MPRKFVAAANWKNQCNVAKVADVVGILNGLAKDTDFDAVEVIVAPAFVHLQGVVSAIEDKNIKVASQNIADMDGLGAFTGQITAEVVKDLGIDTTILGHSESRSLAKESEALVGSKTKRALDAGMNVIVCIGETLEEREAGKLEDVLKAQLTPVCEAIGSVEGGWARTIIAYEPVWAIGTGVTATPAQAQDAHKVVRAYLSTNCSAEVGESTRILYGGSVKAANCGELIQLPDVDGFLVGGASLKPEFADIVATAAKA